METTRQTIDINHLMFLTAVNSPKLPQAVEIDGNRREFVGIGWITVGPARGDEVLVTVPISGS